MHKEKLTPSAARNPIWWEERMSEAGEEEEEEGLGEDECCWVGEGASSNMYEQ